MSRLLQDASFWIFVSGVGVLVVICYFTGSWPIH